MQFCQGHWDPNLSEGRKALVPAQRVVAAVPDFSWGWAAVAGAYWKVAGSAESSRLAEEARASGRQAADRAVAIDGKNSEALYIKSMLIDPHDWIGRESLLKRAVAARRLDCGCEHHQYGWMLLNVGRVADAVDQLRQANDMLALYVYTPLTLADGLLAAGKRDEARQYFDSAIALAPDSGFADRIAVSEATETGDIQRLLDPKLPIHPYFRAALLKGYRAVESRDAGAKAEAIRALLALPEDQQDDSVARLLGELGANQEAFRLASRIAATGEYPGPSIFWHQSMRATLSDSAFPAVAERLGLMHYWRTTHTKPDVCSTNAPPPFCRLI
jgi:tetratricopeptide (TPR) repeat protein